MTHVVFNSLVFAAFFAIFLVLYWTSDRRLRNPLLLVGSYIFYGWWDWRFLGLIALSTVVDYTIALQMHRRTVHETRRRLLWLSLAINLGILGLFKYYGFFVDSFVELTNTLGLGSANPSVFNIVLPVGISFYTFQTLSYTFDVYRKRIAPTSNFLTFATYVAYFPQLVAGPIERAQDLLPRIENIDRPFPRAEQIQSGIGLILLGLVRKVVLADGVAAVANEVFSDPDGMSSAMVAMGVLAFAVQIYGDFAGYTDIARGVSRLLGIELVVNFRQPYLSRNITEFWRRWHISLSNWLRDYLYISMGGNRKGVAKTYRNLMMTMLLGGLWHGSSWNFVVWGGLHGLYLVVHKLFRGGDVNSDPIGRRDVPAIALTFVVAALTWIPFRAATLGETGEVLKGIISFRGGFFDAGDAFLVVVLAAITLALDLAQRRISFGASPIGKSPALAGAAASAAVMAILMFSGGESQPFIYFQF